MSALGAGICSCFLSVGKLCIITRLPGRSVAVKYQVFKTKSRHQRLTNFKILSLTQSALGYIYNKSIVKRSRMAAYSDRADHT